MTRTDEFAEVLRTGPFCRALSMAVQARGLSLRQLHYRLDARGASVSAMTLSHWQSGRSVPEREESLRAVEVLEEVLALQAGSLRRLVGSRRPRGRGVRSAISLHRRHRAWGHPAFLPPLLEEFRDSLVNPARKIELHETFHIRADRRTGRLVVRELIEARQDRTRTMIFAARSKPGIPPPMVAETRGCRPGTVLTLEEEGFSLTELVLDRTLRRGERLAIGFVQEYPRPIVAENHHRRIAESVGHYHCEVVFADGAEPVACRTWRTRTPENRTTGWVTVRPDAEHIVHVSRRNAAPGIHGLQWTWE
ncbi:helix-turn-helix transcriptional regulator [Amycolatopsis oliviviridis]|uniref:XRE family transcriptional regulator n=1 Tax=Amycolatopsis oliviviridis TaxID=1471590 RepID=A0ABQ3M2Y3_9PSEU|nr:hypothetical protein [Amycolatopsis oliviviridis]GHH32270.1 hypothetical protein GCM10017790_69130 [Amycolatopsis oliviviridis]